MTLLLLLAAFAGGVAASPWLRSWRARTFPPRSGPPGGAGNG